MNSERILTTAAMLVSGGAMGAVITSAVTRFRARKQPVTYDLLMIPLFEHSVEDSALKATITVEQEGTRYDFQNMFVLEATFVNVGNQDIPEFPAGLTLHPNDHVIHVASRTTDRHHTVQVATEARPNNSVSELDFLFKPFNRKDKYTLTLYVVTDDEAPGDAKPSSSHPIRFIEPTSMRGSFFGGVLKIFRRKEEKDDVWEWEPQD
jgi:hypothetical protein